MSLKPRPSDLGHAYSKMAALSVGQQVSLDDNKVLETIFNPDHPVAGTLIRHLITINNYIGLDLPSNASNNGINNEEELMSNLAELKALETAAVKLAEGEQLTEALQVLSQAIDLSPNYASAYNNRAQVRERVIYM